jgi:two-component system alkaline phosphatase synthesis response regulator PhoP
MNDVASTRPAVLLVDDEEDLLEMLAYPLEREGFRVLTARDGVEGLRVASAEQPDLVVLDVMMPRLDGMEVTRRMREDARLRLTPILMLTARTAEGDEIEGLDAGADDYLIKPVSARLFVTRVKALLRRGERDDAAPTAPLVRVHDLTVDRGRYLVFRQNGAGEKTFRLPRKEFELLFYLASHPGRVFSRDELLDAVWGRDVFVVDRTVDVHVRKIREKLGSEYIETVKGVGYKLAETLAS